MGDGLTVKERLALLQNNNKNPSLSGPMTATAASPPTIASKPKPAQPPSSSSPSPAFPALKPVPGNKPGVAAKKTPPAATPGGGPAGNKPALSPPGGGPAGNKPALTPPGGGPAAGNKPALTPPGGGLAGNKPAAAPPAAGKPALKPPPKPWVRPEGSGPKNGQDGGGGGVGGAGGGTAAGNPLFPKLRSVGGGPSTPPKKPQAQSSSSSLSSFSSSSPSAAEAPSEGSSGGSGSTAAKDNNSGTPSLQRGDRPPSVLERMKALNQNSADGSSSSSNKETTNKAALNGVAGGGPPPSTLPKFPHSSNTAVSRNHTAANGPTDNSTTALPPPPPLKPSDIAKNINKAAQDKVLRDSKQRGDGGAGNRKSSELFVRHSDGKRFRKVQVATAVSTSGDPPPAKPAKIENVDLAAFLKAYAAAKGEKICADAAKSSLPVESGEGETEETYVEAESGKSIPVATRGSVKRAKSVRISQIPEFTEEEEEMDDTYDDACSAQSPGIPEETYDDCSSEKHTTPVEADDPDEIYEPFDEDMPACPPVPLTPIPQEKKKEKDKDKEKDKEGKKKDKEEKEKKKKEDDIKKQRTKYGLTEADEKVGDGVVKNNCRAGLLTKDLGVAKGEIVAILRMDGNPAGKWLVQNDVNKLGYVMSNNIEVSTPTIRNVMLDFLTDDMNKKRHSLTFEECLFYERARKSLMTGLKTDNNNAIVEDDPEELYEAFPDEEQDDVYEAI